MPTVKAQVRLYIPCPSCEDGTFRGFRADQMGVGQPTTWTCDKCLNEFHVVRLNETEFQTLATGRKETPVTVTLESVTEPKITLKLNTWKYAHSQNLPQEEYVENERYFYNMHTCPKNWTSEIAMIEFEDDRDPHGVFQFVSVEDGHYTERA